MPCAELSIGSIGVESGSRGASTFNQRDCEDERNATSWYKYPWGKSSSSSYGWRGTRMAKVVLIKCYLCGYFKLLIRFAYFVGLLGSCCQWVINCQVDSPCQPNSPSFSESHTSPSFAETSTTLFFSGNRSEQGIQLSVGFGFQLAEAFGL